MPTYNHFISQKAAFTHKRPLTIILQMSKQDIVLGDLNIHTCKNHRQFIHYTSSYLFLLYHDYLKLELS